MNTIISSIFEFNRRIVKIGDRELKPLDRQEALWLSKALKEEADELLGAMMDGIPLTANQDPKEVLTEQVDACIDAAIFAIGGLARLGLTSLEAELCIMSVMDANFEKKAGVKPGREGAPDAVKPEGWVGPEARIKEILRG